MKAGETHFSRISPGCEPHAYGPKPFDRTQPLGVATDRAVRCLPGGARATGRGVHDLEAVERLLGLLASWRGGPLDLAGRKSPPPDPLSVDGFGTLRLSQLARGTPFLWDHKDVGSPH